MFCMHCGVQVPEGANHCPACGAKLPEQVAQSGIPASPPPPPPPGAFQYPAGQQPPQNIPQQQKSNSKIVLLIVGAVLVFFILPVFGILAAVAIPNFMRAKNRSMYTACIEQMANVKTGVEAYLTENDSLTGANVPDDMCKFILPGFDNSKQCYGKVKERIDSVCRPGSFSFETSDGYSYEIKANSQDKTNCAICVTEAAATPERYDDCRSPQGCVH